VSTDGVWDGIFRSRSWGRWPAEEVVRAVARWGRPGLHVLEVGCAAGAQLWYLDHEGHRPVGLDTSPAALDQARVRLTEEGAEVPLVRGDACELPFATASFDLVLDVETFAHVGSDVAQRTAWSEAARVLRPEGRLVSIGFTATTAGADGGRPVDDRTRTDLTAGPLAGVGPVTFIGIETARELCAAAGLELLEHQARRRTVGPDHDCVDEIVVVAGRA
jgi:SAM-dependent methyltransferase